MQSKTTHEKHSREYVLAKEDLTLRADLRGYERDYEIALLTNILAGVLWLTSSN